jgi:divinyl protochlorophyllide a 8-vinyl-reductase
VTPSAELPANLLKAKVGPNAVTQLAAVLEARCGAAMADAVFAAGDVFALRLAPPSGMIPQDHAIAVHRALHRLFLPLEAQAIAYEPGLRTGDYLLAHRIPKLAQVLLKLLPKRQSADLLGRAISANAWTFAGAGAVRANRCKDLVTLEIAVNPLAGDPCAWHCGVFERLFRVLISPQAQVRETACVGAGAPACVFEISL